MKRGRHTSSDRTRAPTFKRPQLRGTREVILCVDDLGRSTPQAGPGSMADRGARPTVQVNTRPAPRMPHGAGCASEDERGKQTVNSIYDR